MNSLWIFPIALVVDILFPLKYLAPHRISYGETVASAAFLSICIGLSFALRYHRNKNTFSKTF